MKSKYDEMYRYYTETETVVQERISGIENKLNMKEQEVLRLKQIIYGKEDIIRKVSIAYEQAKNNLEDYIDEIEYLKQRLSEHEGQEYSQVVLDNQSLRSQNKQLLTMLMTHLTNVDKRSGSNKSKKKSKLNDTMINNDYKRQSFLNASMKRRSKQKIKPQARRKPSSKRKSKKIKVGRARALTSDRYFNNSNQLQDYRNLSSLTPLNKNLIRIQNSFNQVNNNNNNYNSFDNTLDKAQMNNYMTSSQQQPVNRSVMHPNK